MTATERLFNIINPSLLVSILFCHFVYKRNQDDCNRNSLKLHEFQRLIIFIFDVVFYYSILVIRLNVNILILNFYIFQVKCKKTIIQIKIKNIVVLKYFQIVIYYFSFIIFS